MGAPNLPAAYFVSTDITEREVTLANGEVNKLPFREPNSKVLRRYYSASMRGTGSDEFDLAVAELIATCLVNPDGSPALTIERASALKLTVQVAMANAILEETEPGKPSKPGPKNGSGMSSRKTSRKASSSSNRPSPGASSSDGSSSTNSKDG